MRVEGAGLRTEGSGLRVQGSGFRVQGSGFRVQGAGSRVSPLAGGVGLLRLAVLHAQIPGVEARLETEGHLSIKGKERETRAGKWRGTSQSKGKRGKLEQGNTGNLVNQRETEGI